MTDFIWFIFEPLTIEDFQSIFENKEVPLTDYFRYWEEFYTHAANKFYYAQYDRHKLMEFRKFARAENLNISFPEELGLVNSESIEDDWEQWKEQSDSLQEHREFIQSLEQDEPQKTVMPTMLDIAEKFGNRLMSGWWGENFLLAKGYWFSRNISNNHLEYARLRQLKYTEYLQSLHWKRVRSAMMLLEEATCDHCNPAGQLYGGDWETDINIHHLNYRNLGNEKYSDLILLCNHHHRLVHNVSSGN